MINANMRRLIIPVILLLLLIFPFVTTSTYLMHMVILIFIWSYVVTVWSYMGRFGLISLGHGAFFGIGAYTTAILFNGYNISPWIGMFMGALAAAAIAVILGYSCFRFGVIGHYFSIATLILAELSALVVISLRDSLETGGRLGLTLRNMDHALLYFQFDKRIYFYFITLVLLIVAMYLWKVLDRSRLQKALKALGEDEEAALSLGIDVIRFKTAIFATSAFMTAIGGTLYLQFTMFVDPTTSIGVGLSLNIVFKAIIGGIYTLWGPAVGSLIIVVLEEYTRLTFGSSFISYSQILYGLLIIILIRFLPGGLYGTLEERLTKKSTKGAQSFLVSRANKL